MDDKPKSLLLDFISTRPYLKELDLKLFYDWSLSIITCHDQQPLALPCAPRKASPALL